MVPGLPTRWSAASSEPGVLSWTEVWLAKTHRNTSNSMLAPLIDNRDDWHRLRNLAYGGDPLLKLCDVSHKIPLADHISCAIMYDTEIRALINTELEQDEGT
ncbi:hypothetical protein C6341_g26032 [Phytophthora cactorum]|nr:hypothetical protein C6341_g26032 [Phytophthora cactorum]